MKIKVLLSGFLLLLSTNLFAAADWQSAAVEVEKSIEKMLQKVAPYKGKVDADLEPLYQDLERITNQSVDYPYLSKIVMGKYYRRANSDQKEEFQKVFKRTLLKTYGKTLVSFDIKSYELIKPRGKSPKPNKQKVVVKVTSTSGNDYNLINYMVLKDGSWKLVNIILDGFNLRVTFKNQFSSIAQNSKGDLSKTIQEWSKVMSKQK
jgi:phospholipid transport system substrate-binding protein